MGLALLDYEVKCEEHRYCSQYNGNGTVSVRDRMGITLLQYVVQREKHCK